MAYNSIPTTEFDPGEPVKSEHGKAFFDNPTAIASHDDSGDTAPRVWADEAAADASAISSTGTAGHVLTVSSTPSPDGHGNLVVPIIPPGITGTTQSDSAVTAGATATAQIDFTIQATGTYIVNWYRARDRDDGVNTEAHMASGTAIVTNGVLVSDVGVGITYESLSGDGAASFVTGVVTLTSTTNIRVSYSNGAGDTTVFVAACVFRVG